MPTTRNLTLKDLDLREAYDSGDLGQDIVLDFFEPALSAAVSYNRIAGYFNSGMLAACARGMAKFISSSAKMRLICSPQLSHQDIEKLKSLPEDESLSHQIFENALTRGIGDLEALEDLLEKNHIEAMAWMISKNRLDIRVAIPNDLSATDQLFHQKRGILEDLGGNRISFSGSINETRAGWSGNVEEFKVFRSWIPGQSGFVDKDLSAFTNYWRGDANFSHRSIELPEAFRRSLITQAPKDVTNIDLAPIRRERDEQASKELRPLRNYQEAALTRWLGLEMRGILQMATGSGKTLIAAHCIQEFLRAKKRGLVVVTAPYQHIADQWVQELSSFRPMVPGRSRNWRNELSKGIRNVRSGLADYLVVVTVQNTAAASDFVAQVEEASSSMSTLLVGDEAHALGAKQMSKSLSEGYSARLGLTATPTRYFDEEGSNQLLDFFGGSIFEFSLRDALQTKDDMGISILCPYEYFPVFFNLTESELAEYRKLSLELLMLSGKEDETSKTRARMKVLRRARVLKSSSAKIPEFRQILQSLPSLRRLVIYCENKHQMEEAAIVLNELNVKYARFSGEESIKPDAQYGGTSERERILSNFTAGYLDALVAMKCLDEGVNIPTAEIAILLASSGNQKEFIQRRGRMMRQSPSTGKYKAQIYDLVAIPELRDDKSRPTADELSIMRKELARVKEFGSEAVNSDSLEMRLYDLREQLGIEKGE